MEEWKEYKLGEVVNILDYKRVPLSSKERSTRKGHYPYYGAQGIIDYIDDYIFDGTYLLIAEDGENLKSQKQNVAQLASGKYWVNNHAHIVENNGKSDIRYICYLLNMMDLSGYITGSAQPKLNQANLTSISLQLPSLESQKRVADFLSIFDDKIEVNRRINDNLEQQAQALFKSWFVDFEPFKDGGFEETEQGMIPKGWKAGSLEDITTQKAERVGEREDVKVLSPVTTGQLMLSEEYFTKQVFSESIAKYKVVEKGDFAYNPARVNIGSLGRNNYDFDGCVSPVYVVFSCKDGYAHLFDLYRKTEKFKTEVNLRAIGGVRQSLNYKDFAFIQCIIPPLYVVEEFNAIYDHLLVMQRHTGEECDRLTQLRDALLPRLMSGEIKVGDVTLKKERTEYVRTTI